MENNTEAKKRIRNPFPKIAKVFKYEMKHSVRILLPVYAALVVIALIAGLFLYPNTPDVTVELSVTGVSYHSNDSARVLFGLLYWILGISSFVITMLLLNRRFKNGLLGDEAYLNLSLPVTLGEHVWGRVLAATVWILAYMVTVLLSAFAITVRHLGELPDAWESLSTALEISDSETAGLLALLALYLFTASLLLMLFIYLVNSIGHLAKKHRTLVKLLAVVVILTVTSRIEGVFFSDALNGTSGFLPRVLAISSLYNAVCAVVFGIATYLTLNFKLNLE